jgi:PPK2 family polyphosphate:nucleotide phosphotransferase
MSELDSKHFIDQFRVRPGKRVSLRADFDPSYAPHHLSKADADSLLHRDLERLTTLQDRLFAQKSNALLIILQAMDAAGKDSVVKHVMSGLNPQGCDVWSFKEPSAEELEHDFLWRATRALPERGLVGIFNRSYYEEVLIVRVHPELLQRQRLPEHLALSGGLWKRRFKEINAFEEYLVDNGIAVLKFFLYVSREEQKRRFLERIERPEKNWKFSANDVRERAYRDAYMGAYEEMINHTSTRAAPWYVVPADHKWFTRLGVAAVIAVELERLNPTYPAVSEEQRQELAAALKLLERESASA